ncbi:MAG: galactokinase [Bacteroidales bacterium]
MILKLTEVFNSIYGQKAEELLFFFAPGRVNLIGEHTDYNGGYVIPCALNLGTYLVVRKSAAPFFRFSSGNFPGTDEVSVEGNFRSSPVQWVNYPLGVIDQLYRDGHSFEGLELHFHGDIPVGAGLSSSASIEMVTAFALNTIFSLGYKKEDLARLCQKAENEFVGMNCGIMDQFASALGKADHAIFLNCKTLNYVEVPLRFKDHNIVIVNTNKTRTLADSRYNERRSECSQALAELQTYKHWGFLGEIPLEEFLKAEEHIVDDTLAKRAYHVVSEDKRVLESAKALHTGDLEYFGKLMFASHESLKTLFEVSCFELDVLVEEASKIPGVLGARMTGGGFGGCTLNLVEKNATDQFIQTLKIKYYERTGLQPDFYLPFPADGARQLM